ncbi:MAG: hypothetical protein WDO16_24045 [Bacteroidota bacterium]
MKIKRTVIAGYLLYICCFQYSVSYSQHYSLQAGIGLGSTLAKNENATSKSRIRIQLNGYYNFTSQQSAGFEISTAGSFINSVGGNTGEGDVDPTTNTQTLRGSNMNAGTFLLKYRYYLKDKEKGFKPFVEMGAGVNTYYRKIFNVPALSSQKVKRTNFAFQPEAGFSAGGFQVSVSYLYGGRTPAFTVIDDQGVNVKLESIRISPLYLNMGYRFDF